MTECKARGLSTARAVLCVLTYITESQRGVSAREVADRLQKSLSTAYHLLASLEAEGFIERVGRGGQYELVADKRAPTQHSPQAPAMLPPDAHRALDTRMNQVFALTGRRTCIGIFADGGVHVVRDVGRQGLPRMGNIEQPRIRATAHALAMGKLLLAELDEDGLRRWEAEYGPQVFTKSTIIDPAALRRELAEVRRRGIATDCCEYDADFGSLAVPIVDATGRTVAAIATTVTRHQFAVERDSLELALLSVTRELGGAQLD